MNINLPISAGRCLIHMEDLHTRVHPHSSAGVRLVSPSSGGGEEHYCPPSDVYMHVSLKEAQALAAYFSTIARTLQGVE